ncbi:hypothetical protein H7X46_07515 [Pseudonocardia sp. C8]|uniref:hypothetical protein n=1 Tax=Pseudonocardia sp. C8 TaxID=2762759 RepID=UPI001642C95C|nr:hypothetical protein [Pseudonocardia sp. C8]MBC3190909.1 hypothetical protein [Pseudonocardia sp. C8]
MALVAVGGTAWTASGTSPDGVAPTAAPPSVPPNGAGEGVVTISDGAAEHPAAQLVLEQVQRYFNAINGRDYATWARVVSPERAERQPREAWLDGVGTTIDGTIRVDRIDPAPGHGVQALVRFVSVQNPEDGPPGLQVGRICWQATYPMAGSPPRILVGDAGSVLGAPC